MKRLSERERREIRKMLRRRDSGVGGYVTRLGRVITHPPGEAGDVKRYRFGIAMVGLAIFQMVLVAVLPEDDRRWVFFGFAWITLFVGGWQIDRAKSR